jgi:hypothetical protein
MVEKIINTERPYLLVKISKLLQNEKAEDWWNDLPPEVQGE